MTSTATPTRRRRQPKPPQLLGHDVVERVTHLRQLPAHPTVWRDTAAAAMADGLAVWWVTFQGQPALLTTAAQVQPT